MESSSFRRDPRLPWMGQFLICVTVAWSLALPASSSAQGGRSMRGMVSRVRSMQNRQKQQMVKQLQAGLDAARTTLSEAESRLSSSAPALQTARSELEAAKERETAKEQAAHDAARLLHDLETKLLAEQPADSPVAIVQKDLEQAQITLDGEVHHLLSLPAHAAGVTEADRASERLALTVEQKQRLKDDPAYVQAAEKVEALHAHLADQKKSLFEHNSAWQEAHSARQSIAQDLKSLEENRKSAAAEVARHLREVKAAQGAVANAQRVIQASSSQLSALGAAPKPAAPPK